jgi:hypothetical protein
MEEDGMSVLPDLVSLLGEPAEERGFSKARIAMILRWLAEEMEEEKQQTPSSVMPEDSIRVRPDFMPSGGD